MEVSRIINLPALLKKKSFFLFGPRSTGKSTLAGAQLAGEALFIDLLDGATFLRLAADPSMLEQMIS
jgi:AAA+ ATPase superfamily predicted ATPase